MAALLIAVLCVLANAFFVAAEFALVKVRPTALEALAAEGDIGAKRALAATHQLDAYLSATQLGITLASLGLGWVGEPALAHLIAPALDALHVPRAALHPTAAALAFAVITLLHIVVGELAPKSLAIQRPERVARLASGAMRVFYVLSYPVLYVLNGTSNGLLRTLGMPPADHMGHAPSADEIRLIVQSSFRAGSLSGPERDLMEKVLRGARRTVKAIMVPRVDMTTVAHDASIETLKALMRDEGFSRFPMCEDNDPDRIVGYVYAKDLWMASAPRGAEPGSRIEHLRREIHFVPESRTVAEVLEDFRRTSVPIAIVVDEYGGTSGLVTLEDCVEEIVGDIQDETDEETSHTLIRPDGTVVVDATVPFADLEVEELRHLCEDGDETVGGFVMESLGRLPRRGDRLQLGDFEVTVELVTRRRVRRVAFRALEPNAASEPPGSQPPAPGEEAHERPRDEQAEQS